MFFKKLQKKAEGGLQKAEVTLDGLNDIVIGLRSEVSGIKWLITISTVGALLGIVADIVTITNNRKR